MKVPTYVPVLLVAALIVYLIQPFMEKVTDKPDSEVVVAKVNDVSIYRSDYLINMESASTAKLGLRENILQKYVINEMVNAELIFQENADRFEKESRDIVIRESLADLYSHTTEATSGEFEDESYQSSSHSEVATSRMAYDRINLQKKKEVYLEYAESLREESDIRIYWGRL
jgi:hypothetical protein